MARSIKAFATHSFFTTNTKLIEHTFGELSTDSRTYEKDVGIYSHNTDKAINLVLFSSTNNNKEVEPTTDDINISLDVSKYIFDYTIAAAKEIYTDELKRSLLTQFRDKLQSFSTGEVVTDGEYYCVQWVSFKDLNNNEFIIWFSDKSFKSEYDEFEIAIVPPVEEMDVFFSTKPEVEKELAKRPVDILTRIANTTKANSPVTIFRLDVFKWHHPVTEKPELDTNWYVLIWGDAGDNIDSVKEKIQEVILSKSKHSRDEWRKIFPDIFRRNEFIIVPQWDVFANENKVKEKASLYSPFIDYSTIISKYKPYFNEVSETHVKKHAQTVSLYYRSLAAVTCSSDENKDDKFKISDIYPDFIDVPSTSTDFNYQSKATQDWSLKIQDMLAVAESMTPTSVLPREKVTLATGEIVSGEKIFTKVTRNNKLFLVTKVGDFHYLVAAKYNVSQ